MGRVIVVNDFAHGEGGASHVAISSAIGLASRGHEVTYLTAVGPIAPELCAGGVRVLTTDQQAIASDASRLRALRQGLWNPAAGRLLSSCLDEARGKRTIVHLHGWTKALSSIVVRTVVRRNIPIVCTLNDYFTACPNGGFFDYPRGEVCTRAPLGVSCLATQCDKRGYAQKLWRVARQTVQRQWGLIPRGIRHYIAVSEFSVRVLRPFLPPDARFYAVPNLIEMSREEPVPVSERTAYVMVGRLSREKGPALFAEAASHAGVEAVFVGDGDGRAEVRVANPGARITGWVSRNVVIDHLRRARVLVFPSLWYEAQPLAVREAAALGVPAIVSDRCAARDDVEPERTGLWFRGGDVEDLVRQIRRCADGQIVQAMGTAAYKRYWAAPATVERHVLELERVYDDVCKGWRS